MVHTSIPRVDQGLNHVHMPPSGMSRHLAKLHRIALILSIIDSQSG